MSWIVFVCAWVVGGVDVPDSPKPPQGVLVVLNKGAASVSAFDPTTGKELWVSKVGEGPHEAATAPDGGTVVVCNYGGQSPGNTLSVLDAATGKSLRTIDLGENRRPHGIRFVGDHRIVVTSEAARKLLVVDTKEAKVLHAIDTDQETSHMVAVDAKTSRAFVANIRSGSITVIDLAKNERLKVIPTGDGAEGICVVPERNEVWVTNRAANTVTIIDSAKLEVLAQLECGTFPIRAEATPGGRHVLVSCAQSAEVVVFDTEKRTESTRIGMPPIPDTVDPRKRRLFGGRFGNSSVPIGILIEPSGERAYIANTYSDLVTVLDLSAWTVLRSIETRTEPDGMSWVPAPARREEL